MEPTCREQGDPLLPALFPPTRAGATLFPRGASSRRTRAGFVSTTSTLTSHPPAHLPCCPASSTICSRRCASRSMPTKPVQGIPLVFARPNSHPFPMGAAHGLVTPHKTTQMLGQPLGHVAAQLQLLSAPLCNTVLSCSCFGLGMALGRWPPVLSCSSAAKPMPATPPSLWCTAAEHVLACAAGGPTELQPFAAQAGAQKLLCHLLRETLATEPLPTPPAARTRPSVAPVAPRALTTGHEDGQSSPTNAAGRGRTPDFNTNLRLARGSMQELAPVCVSCLGLPRPLGRLRRFGRPGSRTQELSLPSPRTVELVPQSQLSG